MVQRLKQLSPILSISKSHNIARIFALYHFTQMASSPRSRYGNSQSPYYPKYLILLNTLIELVESPNPEYPATPLTILNIRWIRFAEISRFPAVPEDRKFWVLRDATDKQNGNLHPPYHP